MRTSYPDYKKRRLNKSRLKPKDRQILADFLEYLSMTAGDKRISMAERQLLQFRDVTGTPFNRMTLKILRRFLALLNKSDKGTETKNDIKKTIKRFLRWYYADWSNRFDELRDIKTADGTNHKKINAATILTADEINVIVRAIESLKYKALTTLLYESAARPEELLKLKWNDVHLDKGEVKLYSSKTRRTRVVPIKECIGHLRRYKQECFFPPAKPGDYVFPSPRNEQKHLTVSSLDDFFRKLEKRLKFAKHLFPYLFRHSRLTLLHKKLSPKCYEKIPGHSIELGTKRYAHLSNDDVREEMFAKIFAVEELGEEDNKKLVELEHRIRKLEATIHAIIDKANIVLDTRYPCNLPPYTTS
jgi:integrase